MSATATPAPAPPAAPSPFALLDCRMAHASLLAYAIATSGGAWSVPQNDDYKAVGFASPPACFADGEENIDAGLVGTTTDGWALVAFRGTLPPFEGDFWAWADDWLQDFEAGPVPFTVGGKPFGNVEQGFAAAMGLLWPKVEAALAALDLRNAKGILVTGHSKGAALCFLGAALVKAAYPNMLVKVRAFAAPLACDRAFQDLYDNNLKLGAFSVRYQNIDDLVPFLPWVPAMDVLATAERIARSDSQNHVVTLQRRQDQVDNDYVPLGSLRFIDAAGGVVLDPAASHDALIAIEEALLMLDFEKIAHAHSMGGAYLSCPCAVVATS